jgi:aryl-alcohol dehydrogenase-like predicted oxidoreductase
METRSLGATGPEIPVLGYGAWVTGADTETALLDEALLSRAIREALDAGISVIDTAEIYARGRSEEIVGRAVREVRDDVFLITKLGPSGVGTGMRPRDVSAGIRASLRRLGTDRVDLYLLHWHDPTVAVEDTWGAMARLVEEGLARFVGVSNFDGELIVRCHEVAPVHAVENQLSILHRDDEALAASVSERGIAFLAYGALAFGLLSGRVTPDAVLDPTDWRSGGFARYESNYYEELFAPERLERNHAVARGLAAIGADVGVPPAVLAFRWVLERPGVTATIVGTTDPGHLRENALAGRMRLDPGTRSRIDRLIAADSTPRPT